MNAAARVNPGLDSLHITDHINNEQVCRIDVLSSVQCQTQTRSSVKPTHSETMMLTSLCFEDSVLLVSNEQVLCNTFEIWSKLKPWFCVKRQLKTDVF